MEKIREIKDMLYTTDLMLIEEGSYNKSTYQRDKIAEARYHVEIAAGKLMNILYKEDTNGQSKEA